MSAFVCSEIAAALGRASSDEVMLGLDEQEDWEMNGEGGAGL